MKLSLDELIALRRERHRQPELSGAEAKTARRLRESLTRFQPDRLIDRLGGHGLAAVFEGAEPGPTVLLRCELDALPIDEVSAQEAAGSHASTVPGVSHKCGHDGHMAILVGIAGRLAARRPGGGRAVLLFQPAEETGAGARAVIEDPRFAEIRPDWSFALHNLPGYPMGQVIVREGTFNCASRGLTIELAGKTAHAAQPESGLSPARATGRLIDELGMAGASETDLTFATVVGAELGTGPGESAFGTAPGWARVKATLRSEDDARMALLVQSCESAARRLAEAEGLGLRLDYRDVFPATVNGPRAVALVRTLVGPAVHEPVQPMRWSEDFGRFTAISEGALIGLGAGETTPALHHPDYDFPDALLDPGVELFGSLLEELY